MEISRSEPGDRAAGDAPVDPAAIDIDPVPEATEAAAIAAAIDAHLTAEQDDETGTETTMEWWRTHGWRLSGRFRRQHGTIDRPREGTPQDPWRAADRARRW